MPRVIDAKMQHVVALLYAEQLGFLPAFERLAATCTQSNVHRVRPRKRDHWSNIRYRLQHTCAPLTDEELRAASST